MFPPKKILFPVDFSEHCIGAARFVEAMTGRFEAELVLLHILEPPGYYGLPETVEAAETRLAMFQRDEFRYFRVRRMVEKADEATEKILAVSRAENIDLIMMPTSGIGRYRRFILGSVTAKVLHDADCPVWTGVHLEQAPPLEALRIQNIVCAVDLKPHSERVLEWAQQMSGEYQAALHVVHAIPAYETRPASYFDAELRLNLEAEGKEAIQKFLNARGVEAAIDVHGGEVAHVVRCAAQRLHADLVIIGRSSENGLVGRLRANAYSIIRQSPCPVVSV
jgi:nucleotide-binding universal stress UspA family protein